MISSELLLTFIVALIVFGPNKLPMLAQHLGRFLRQLDSLKQQASQFWQKQIDELQLEENKGKAEQADRIYEEQKRNK